MVSGSVCPCLFRACMYAAVVPVEELMRRFGGPRPAFEIVSDIFLTFSLASIFSPEKKATEMKKKQKKHWKRNKKIEKRNAEKEEWKRMKETRKE
jgi:hypothetical protein